MMWAVWGAPTHPIQFIALYSSMLLPVAGLVCVFAPVAGRRIATVSILGIGILYIPASASLVPSANAIVSPVSYFLVFVYFALLAFALFYPRRWRWSIATFAVCFLTGVTFAATTYFHRVQEGEVQFPAMAYYEWVQSKDTLNVERDDFGWITPEAFKSLTEHGVTGILRWNGSSGDSSIERKIVVICSSRIPEPKKLPHPKSGTIIYIFDGTAWKTIPDHADVYPTFATLQTDGELEQVLPSGGTQGGSAFSWR